jgi:lipid A ethanolaminephosphotransferase
MNRIREMRVPRGVRCPSETHFAFAVSCSWAALYNVPFWAQSVGAMWHPTLGGAAFVVSLFIVVMHLQAMLLLLMPSERTLRAAASILFIVAAVSAYFCSEYGAIMNKDMLRNVLQTDPAEVRGLISIKLLASIVVLGIVPAVLVWRVSLPSISWPRRLRERGAALGISLFICVLALFACSASYAVFFREHKPIRFTLMPLAPVSSLAGIVSATSRRDTDGPLLNPAAKSQRVGVAHAKPLVLMLVVGETARAADFELGRYSRPTNPELEHVDNLVYFSNTTSCGTSTAVSVPCMFSHLDRTRFDVDEAGRYTNLLDSLAEAGLAVEWRDNNTGCKGVCARTALIRYAERADKRLCGNAYCYDEVMLTDLAERLRHVDRDTVIVFHQIGSHGPAYSDRYPPEFERFKPACRSNELHHCTGQEVLNAYDNTIAYTDHVLAHQIRLMGEASEYVDGVLIYVSDHGESLGEQGVYLHGMPYAFAPPVQKEVPMLIWTSTGYEERMGLRTGCLQTHARDPLSHDNLYHTVLGATDVRNELYDSKLDILSTCRIRQPS